MLLVRTLSPIVTLLATVVVGSLFLQGLLDFHSLRILLLLLRSLSFALVVVMVMVTPLVLGPQSPLEFFSSSTLSFALVVVVTPHIVRAL